MNFRIWNYIKSAHHPEGVGYRALPADHLNYQDASIMSHHLHEKVWTCMGLVMQSVHYAEFDPVTRVFSVPVVLEKWHWMLDPATSFAIARRVDVQYFADVPENVVIGEVTSSLKYYTTHAMQLEEIERRHRNMIYDIKGMTLKTLMLTETRGDLKRAISIGSKFIEYMHPHIQAYISDGLPLLAEASVTAAVRSRFVWLDNDMTVLGYPGKRLWEVLYGMLQSNVPAAVLAVDRDLLFNQI
jgi:hypothetical protein